MAGLSITSAWNETASFVKANWGALFTIAFALIALPSVIMQALAPVPAGPTASPSAGLWLVLIPAVLVLSIVGTLAITALALGRENVVGRALSLGFRRFLPVLGATLLVALAAVLIMIPLFMLLGITPEEVAANDRAAAGRAGLAVLLFIIVFLFVWVRLMLMSPVAANETGGSIAILRRSWQLTAGRFWKLLGFALLFLIAAFVVMFAATAVLGIFIALIAGRPEPGSLSSVLMLLLGGVLNAAFIVYFATMVARIYRQLAGGGSSSGI